MDAGVSSVSKAMAANLVGWWETAGVDTLVADEPGNWLHEAAVRLAERRRALADDDRQPADDEATRQARPLPPVADASAVKEPLPAPVSDTTGTHQGLYGSGNANAEWLILVEAPSFADPSNDSLLSEMAQKLLGRMLAAIALSPQSVALHGISGQDQAQTALSSHMARQPFRAALILGDGPSRQLLGGGVAETRGRVHQFDFEGKTTNFVTSFAPDVLIASPRTKALAWDDLRLFSRTIHS